MNAQERLTELLEVVAVPSNRGRLTNSALGDLTSPEVAETIYDLIKASTESYAIQFVVGGIDTSTPAWKARVDAIQVNDPGLAQIKPMIRDWETMSQPRWQSLGYDTEPTLESVQAEIDAEQAQLAREAISLVWTAKQAVINEGIFDGTITTLEQIVAAIGGE